jgi:DNA-binding SARP family transcriptional activator
MGRLTLALLGGFEARLDRGPRLVMPAKAQALLAYLATRPGQPHPREKLAALLWGGTAPFIPDTNVIERCTKSSAAA